MGWAVGDCDRGGSLQGDAQAALHLADHLPERGAGRSRVRVVVPAGNEHAPISLAIGRGARLRTAARTLSISGGSGTLARLP